MRAKSSSCPLYYPLHGKMGSAERVSEPKILVDPSELCMGVRWGPGSPGWDGTRAGAERGPSPPHGKRGAALVIQPWALCCGPHSLGVSPAAQVAWESQGFPERVPPG